MLVDISNSLRIHTGASARGNILNDKPARRNGGNRRKSEPREELSESPNYVHTPIYRNAWSVQFPFYEPLEMTRRSPDNIDFTSCIQFARNPIKKYKKPVGTVHTTASTATSLKTSMFGPLGKNGEIDPVNALFLHLPTENRLKLGHLQLDFDEHGKCTLKQLPVTTDMAILEAEIEDLAIGNAPAALDTPKKRRHPFTLFSGSPLKDTTFKPKKLRAKHSPHKPKTNYAKWDKSMTISAKAIMKMVDDSLVSSDTEMYNLSQSFLARTHAAPASGTVSINADDLNDALMEDMDAPLKKFQELSI